MEVAKSRYVEHFSSVEQLVCLMEGVHVFPELTCDALTHRLDSLEQVIAAHNVGLVVVDSIASLVRKEFDTRAGRGMSERAALLARQASRLKLVDLPCLLFGDIKHTCFFSLCRYLAEAFEIPVSSRSLFYVLVVVSCFPSLLDCSDQSDHYTLVT